MRFWILNPESLELNPEPLEFWLWCLQSFLHYSILTLIFIDLFYVLVLLTKF